MDPVRFVILDRLSTWTDHSLFRQCSSGSALPMGFLLEDGVRLLIDKDCHDR